ncbi:MAG: RNA polymerase sigma factor [Christensenellales bacterium]|jgi:RNA polymerase sigma factor (sigma-70 family)
MKPIDEENEWIDRAIAGDREALAALIASVQDMVFNLSLRMLGTVPDAEDATQEILIKVMTNLSAFRRESALSTWVFRIAANHLRSYRKGMFAQRPLSLEAYGEDIASGRERDVPDMSGGVDHELLSRELKLSCSNVMLQCLDADSRCVYILGTMFRLDSRIAAQILQITPEAYRQRLSRVRKRMAAFLAQYCGLSGTGGCACQRRIHYAVATHRLDPQQLDFSSMEPCRYEEIVDCTEAMEQLDARSQVFADFPAYRAPRDVERWVRELIGSPSFAKVVNMGEVSP